MNFSELQVDDRVLAGESGERLVSFVRGKPAHENKLVPRALWKRGRSLGPAIIESYDTTVAVPPGCTARKAGSGCIAIDMEEMDA